MLIITCTVIIIHFEVGKRGKGKERRYRKNRRKQPQNIFLVHRHSQGFLWGVHFLLDQKSDDLFCSHHPLFHGHIRYILPPTTLFLSSAGVHLTKFSPIFASFQQKCLEQNFSRRLGYICTPCSSPGYAYVLITALKP